jgi:hypothetical protein
MKSVRKTGCEQGHNHQGLKFFQSLNRRKHRGDQSAKQDANRAPSGSDFSVPKQMQTSMKIIIISPQNRVRTGPHQGLIFQSLNRREHRGSQSAKQGAKGASSGSDFSAPKQVQSYINEISPQNGVRTGPHQGLIFQCPNRCEHQ